MPKEYGYIRISCDRCQKTEYVKESDNTYEMWTITSPDDTHEDRVFTFCAPCTALYKTMAQAQSKERGKIKTKYRDELEKVRVKHEKELKKFLENSQEDDEEI